MFAILRTCISPPRVDRVIAVSTLTGKGPAGVFVVATVVGGLRVGLGPSDAAWQDKGRMLDLVRSILGP